MDNKELLDNLDIMISEIEWEYPIDHVVTLNKIKEIIKDHGACLHLIDKYEKDILDYDKALDKACKLLEYFDSPTIRIDKRTKQEWKEYLLTDLKERHVKENG